MQLNHHAHTAFEVDNQQWLKPGLSQETGFRFDSYNFVYGVFIFFLGINNEKYISLSVTKNIPLPLI